MADTDANNTPAEAATAAPAPSEAPKAAPEAPGGFARPPKPPAEVLAAWAPMVEFYRRRLARDGMSSQNIGRRLKAVQNEVLPWLASVGADPATLDEGHRAKWPEYLDLAFGPAQVGNIKKQVIRQAGSLLMEEAMANRGKTPVAQLDEVDDGPEGPDDEAMGLDDGQDEGSEPEAPPARSRRAAAPPQVQYVMVQPQAPRGRPPGARDSQPRQGTPRSAAARVLPSPEKLRIFKRGSGGKRMYCTEVMVEDVGNIYRFLKENVDPEHGDASGTTTYEVFMVGADDREKGAPSSITIEGPSRMPEDDPLNKAHSALSLLRQIRDMEEERKGQSNEVLDAAKRQAAEGGNVSNLMMLMMMEKMMGNGPKGAASEEVLLKLIREMRGPVAAPPPAALPPLPPTLFTPPPPPPPAESPMTPIVTKLLEAQLARPEPKPEKSFGDTMKEMMLFMQMMKEMSGGGGEVAALRAELMALRAAQTAPAAAPVGGIEGALANFEKLTNVVKTLAPQVNVGGLTGALQGILTPQLAAALGNMLASGITGGRPAAPPPAPPQPAAAALPAGAPPSAPPPSALPPSALELAGHALAISTEEEVPQKALAVLQVMYGDPAHQPKLEPALQALLAGNMDPALAVAEALLRQFRPASADRMTASRVVHALIASAGGQAPEPEQPVAAAPATPPAEVVHFPEASAAASEPVVLVTPAPATANGAVVEAATAVVPPPAPEAVASKPEASA